MVGTDDDKNWFVLFVRSRSERSVIAALEKKLDLDKYTPFMPTKAIPLNVKGEGEKGRVWAKRELVCFPSYVFISSKANAVEFAQEAIPAVTKIDGVFRVLNYGSDKTDTIMRKDEQQTLAGMMDAWYRINESKGYKDGDKVKIVSGPLVGKESRIRSVNYYRHTAKIDIEIMGTIATVELMIDVMRKVE